MNRLILLTFFILNFIVKAQDKIPIMAFHAFTPSTTNAENFKNFKEAGFSINLTIFDNEDQLQKALDLSQKFGLKMLIYSKGFEDNPEPIVKKFKDHPALFGYFILDEPSPKDFDRVRNLIDRIKKIDKEHPVYVNLYPSYSPAPYLGNLPYKDYVNGFFNKVNVDFISFDYYPVVYNQVRANWYENLEIIRDHSIRLKKDFWAFACSTIHHYYREPTLGGIRLQQYSNLLYGAKGLQYFTYITMDDDYWKRNKYEYSIIYNNGKPTPTYDIVKKVNADIQKLAWIFTTTKVDDIYHMGDSIPVGTKRLNFLPSKFKVFKSFENKALVSFMRNKNREFIIVQNKNINKEIAFNFHINKGVSLVDNNTGKIIAAPTKNTIRKIPAGDILIFTYQ